MELNIIEEFRQLTDSLTREEESSLLHYLIGRIDAAEDEKLMKIVIKRIKDIRS